MSTATQRTTRIARLVALLILCLALLPTVHAAPLPRPAATAQPAAALDPAAEDDRVGARGAIATTEPATARQPAAPQISELVDIDVVDQVRASEFVTYTYSYTNTGSTTLSGVIIQAIWTNFHKTRSGAHQYCPQSPDEPVGCVLYPGSAEGPEVTNIDCPSGIATGRDDDVCFSIGTLDPGQQGKFSVRLRVRKDLFPRTNEGILRLAGSVRLWRSGEGTPAGEDTTNALIVGPVLSLIKIAPSNHKIYPTETAVFTITLGNATGSKDYIGDQPRPDAIPASNIVLIDRFPAGSEFVSTDSPYPYDVDTSARTITYRIPGPLNPGDQIDPIRVTYRKLDVRVDCGSLSNTSLTVSSDEMPIQSGTKRYVVGGKGAGVPVVVPLDIKSITRDPGSVVYGGEAELKITVRSFWDQPINGLQLKYAIQANGYYKLNSAQPAPTSAPSGAEPGGTVLWTFNMPAGSMSKPSEAVFTLRVIGDYSKTVGPGGVAEIITPASVPSACVNKRSGYASFTARLTVNKSTNEDPETIVNGQYIVKRGQQFTFIIEVSNIGIAHATAVTVTDLLPTETNANFSYVPGSARLNGNPREPDEVTNGRAGTINWYNLTVPAGDKITLTFDITVDGGLWYVYCNKGYAYSGRESIKGLGSKVCLKISPNIVVEKKINGQDSIEAQPGETVIFNLKLTNKDTETYNVALGDYLNGFIYDGMVSGEQPAYNGSALKWPYHSVPPNATLEAEFRAIVPDACVTKRYTNEGIFFDQEDGGAVQMVPRELVFAHVDCVNARIEYSMGANLGTASLRDKIIYTLNIRNVAGGTATDVKVENYLPDGFTYLAIEPDSSVDVEPAVQKLPDGRTRLTWSNLTLGTDELHRIKFSARVPDIVGTFDNMMIAFSSIGTKCVSSCTYGDNGARYAYRSVTVHPLITLEPSLDSTICRTPGDTVIYNISILNTNNHDYTDTDVKLSLPFGLQYVQAVEGSWAPLVIRNSDGTTHLYWRDMLIAKRPGGQLGTLETFAVELKVGQIWGSLATQTLATSPDGSIPRKDGVADPVVVVCPPAPSIAKDASNYLQPVGSEFFYQITLANTTDAPLQTTVSDALPDQLSFVQQLIGPAPTVNGNQLTWSNITVPAATEDGDGILVLRFRVRVVAGDVLTQVVNTAEASGFEGAAASVTVVVPYQIYAPVIN